MARGRNRRQNARNFIAALVFLPCACLIGSGVIMKDLVVKARKYEQPSKKRERASRERKKMLMRSTPQRLGPRLEKHLTIGRPEPKKIEEVVELEEKSGAIELVELTRALPVTDGQEKSGLFKLPLELRLKIYEETLGGYIIHVFFRRAYRKMSHTRCKEALSAKKACQGAFCRKVLKLPGVPDIWGNASLLSMLQSCRKIYSEAIEILYTANTFDFDYLNNVLKLSLTLLPERMHLIKTVQWKTQPRSGQCLTTTPWLKCALPLRCHCMICWPKAIGLDDALITRYQFDTFVFLLPKTGLRTCSEN